MWEQALQNKLSRTLRTHEMKFALANDMLQHSHAKSQFQADTVSRQASRNAGTAARACAAEQGLGCEHTRVKRCLLCTLRVQRCI